MTTIDRATPSSRTISVECLTRVEGEGGLYVALEGDRVSDVKLRIFEPPRLFEGFLLGRHATEVPDITARICGICPVAHQMSSIHAIEAAFGVATTPEIRRLRRLLYCAEWIESHALHIYLLNLPDFLGYESALSLAEDQPEPVMHGLRLKRVGNRLLELLGGRPSHPVSPCVGGFYRIPRMQDLVDVRDEVEWAVEAAIETVRIAAALEFPDFEEDYEFVALSHPEEYPLNGGEIVTSTGLRISPDEYEHHFLEEQVAHSTALHSVRAGTGRSYLVGPLARLNLNADRLMPRAAAALAGSGLRLPCRNPFRGIVARAIELVESCEEALAIIETWTQPAKSRVEFSPRAAVGCAVTEAPRGILYHQYRFNAEGLVEAAKIVPPTAQNIRRIEDDLRDYLPLVATANDDLIRDRCEGLIRAYDPCISCSTHFLRLRLDRRP